MSPMIMMMVEKPTIYGITSKIGYRMTMIMRIIPMVIFIILKTVFTSVLTRHKSVEQGD